MTRGGIVGTIQLAATLVFAIPAALLGVQFLLDGKPVPGVAFVAIGVLMVVVGEYLTTPGDLPGAAASKVLGAVAKEPDDDRE